MPAEKIENLNLIQPVGLDAQTGSEHDARPAWETPVLKKGDAVHRTLKISWNTEHGMISGLS
jgi:hypothetical protein